MPRRTVVPSHPGRPYAFTQGRLVTSEVNTDFAYTLFRRDGFTTMPQRTTLHLSGGTGITIAAADDSGNDETDITISASALGLGDLSDVELAGTTEGFVLSFQSNKWIDTTPQAAGLAAFNHTHPASEITDFATEVDARIGAANLDDLTNVAITSVGTDEMLQYDGANWINQTFAELGLVVLGSINVFTASQKILAVDPVLVFQDTTGALDGQGPAWNDSSGTRKFGWQYDDTDLWLYEHNGTPAPMIKFDIGWGRLEFPTGSRPTTVGYGGQTSLSSGEVVFSSDSLAIFDAITVADITGSRDGNAALASLLTALAADGLITDSSS